MEHIDVSNISLAILRAEIFRFVIRTTDLKDPVIILKPDFQSEERGDRGGPRDLFVFE